MQAINFNGIYRYVLQGNTAFLSEDCPGVFWINLVNFFVRIYCLSLFMHSCPDKLANYYYKGIQV